MISTRIISLKTGTEHRSILRLIHKYYDFFIKLGDLKKIKEMTPKGRPFEVYNLTDKQLNFLINILGNTKQTINLKFLITNNDVEGIHTLREHVKKGCLYIIKKTDIDLYKIGISINPNNRINSIETQSGDTVKRVYISEPCEIYNKIENYIHVEYKKYRNIGEWFKLDDSLLETIISQINKKIIRYNKYFKF